MFAYAELERSVSESFLQTFWIYHLDSILHDHILIGSTDTSKEGNSESVPPPFVLEHGFESRSLIQ